MTRIGSAIGIVMVVLAFAGSAQARTGKVHIAAASCPAGVPVQKITIVNNSKVRPAVLSLVENAVVAQSLQVRAAWATPCVVFGPGGWKLYLKPGASGEPWGEHFSSRGVPYVLVWTGALAWRGWSTVFSHEVVETLVDPVNAHYIRDLVSNQLEVADPVEHQAYLLRGVYVSDFVLPAWYAGAQTGDCYASGSAITCPGSVISALDNPGPYDQARVLDRPWQTDSSE
jgi:hypothetical protein